MGSYECPMFFVCSIPDRHLTRHQSTAVNLTTTHQLTLVLLFYQPDIVQSNGLGVQHCICIIDDTVQNSFEAISSVSKRYDSHNNLPMYIKWNKYSLHQST